MRCKCSALSSKTQNRLQRARVLIQDLPSLEQGLDGHLNRLRSHCLVNKSTAVIFYGPQNTFQGDLKSTGVQSPWSCPRREKQWTTWDPVRVLLGSVNFHRAKARVLVQELTACTCASIAASSSFLNLDQVHGSSRACRESGILFCNEGFGRLERSVHMIG